MRREPISRKPTPARANDWHKIVSYLETEGSNANIKICVSCGFAKVTDLTGHVHMINRFQTLETAKIIVEKVKEINDRSN